MLTRIISGLVLSIGVLGLLLYMDWMYFVLFIAIAALIGSSEYQNMFVPQRNKLVKMGLGVLTMLLAISPTISQLNLSQQLYSTLPSALWSISFCVIAFGHLRHPLPIEESGMRVARDILGVVYLGATLPGLLSLRLLDIDQGWCWVLLAMVITFGGDTGGYFAGRAMGGKLFGARRLAPTLSPKKTWEGYLGGLLMGTAGALVARAYFPVCSVLTTLDCMILGVVGVSLGVVGDLFESMLKRSSGVKDSGTLIPGHGGVLDRIDALLFVAPALYCYLAIRLPA